MAVRPNTPVPPDAGPSAPPSTNQQEPSPEDRLYGIFAAILRDMDTTGGPEDGVFNRAALIDFLRGQNPRHPLIQTLEAKQGDFTLRPEAIEAAIEQLIRNADSQRAGGNGNGVLDMAELTRINVLPTLQRLIQDAPLAR